MSDWLYLIKRHDKRAVSLWNSRHLASFAKHHYHDCNDYEIIPIRAFAARYVDVKLPRERHPWLGENDE